MPPLMLPDGFLLLHPKIIDRGLLVACKVGCGCLHRIEPAVGVILLLVGIEIDGGAESGNRHIVAPIFIRNSDLYRRKAG